MKKQVFGVLSQHIRQLCITVMLVAIALPALSSPSASNPGKAKIFGKGMPVQLEDLPPGRAKARLNELPPAARRQALKWLQRFSFPEADLEFLQFDNEGGVFYADTHSVELVAGAESDTTPGVSSGIQPEDTFRLHSRPGATKVVFLDFDGHTISGTAWNYGAPSQYIARPYDIDGFPETFNGDEMSRIQEIWHRVAEDFAPFDIDVTTEDPGVFGPTTGRVLITHNIDANNNAMPHSNAGGVAYIGVYGSSYYEAYLPALVYYNNLGNGYPTYVAEAVSHEFGHNLNLSHDGRDAPYYESYYQGHGANHVSWGAIMGVGYYTNVTQWSRGEYAAGNNIEDDLSLIGSRLGFRPDDHGDMMSSATPLYVEADGSILVTTPETENYQLPSSNNKGVIESGTDIDFFSINTNAGLLDITIQPAWAAFYRNDLRGANLDISATLYNQAGEVVASSNPLDNTDAVISTTVVASNYYLAISGAGNAASPYSDYGSLGQYFISGSIPMMIEAPVAPGDLSASATSYSQINLAWIDNADNETGLFIERSADQQDWLQIASLSQDSISYSDADLSESTTYFYRVGAANSAGSAISNIVSITTPAQVIVPADTDSDGIPDDYENQKAFLDPLNASDAELDQDGDGLTNLQEYSTGSDPTKEDTDNDGLTDKYEVDNSLDPTDGECPSWVCGGSSGWRQVILFLKQEVL